MSDGMGWVAAQLGCLRAAIYDTIIPRRERIATAVLQGLCADPDFTNPERVAELAVQCADALIAELDKEQKG